MEEEETFIDQAARIYLNDMSFADMQQAANIRLASSALSNDTKLKNFSVITRECSSWQFQRLSQVTDTHAVISYHRHGDDGEITTFTVATTDVEGFDKLLDSIEEPE